VCQWDWRWACRRGGHSHVISHGRDSRAYWDTAEFVLGDAMFVPARKVSLTMLDYCLLLIFPAAMVLAAMLDLFTMTIPNRISLLLLGSFLIFAPFTGMAWDQFFGHVGMGAGVLVVGVALFAIGVLGGGDAKLLAAASLWIGYNDFAAYLFIVAQFGAALAVLVLLYRAKMPPSFLLNVDWAMRLHNKKEGIPYGIALAAGALAVFPTTPWFLAVAVA